MPNDQFGNPVALGDTVSIQGEVTKISQDPDYVNCTVRLSVLMPPAGTQTAVQVNTAQLVKQGSAPLREGGGMTTTGTRAEKPPEKPPHSHGESVSKK